MHISIGLLSIYSHEEIFIDIFLFQAKKFFLIAATIRIKSLSLLLYSKHYCKAFYVFLLCILCFMLLVKKEAHAVVYTIMYLVSVQDLTLRVYKHPHYCFSYPMINSIPAFSALYFILVCNS